MKSTGILTPMLLILLAWSCGQNASTSENSTDSLSVKSDSIPGKPASDPNVYEIPAESPWLIKFIGDPFPWNPACTCCKVKALDTVFVPKAQLTTERSETILTTQFTLNDSYVRVAELSFEGQQDCSDNICEVVLTTDWVPLSFGLHMGMSRADFHKALNLDRRLTQKIYTYVYKLDQSSFVSVRFEFENDVMSFFSFQVEPCRAGKIFLPMDPFFTKLFNKPFRTQYPDSVKRMIGTPVEIRVERNYEWLVVDKLGESDMNPVFVFDSSSITFEKWPKWQIVKVDVKSPQFSFINGLKVGLSRETFLNAMGEKDFEGDVFTKGNRYCMDGYDKWNSMTITFEDNAITQIKYIRGDCN